MAIFFFNLNRGGASVTPMIVSANNGLHLDPATNVKLGGTLIEATSILNNGFNYSMSDVGGSLFNMNPNLVNMEFIDPVSGDDSVINATPGNAIVSVNDITGALQSDINVRKNSLSITSIDPNQQSLILLVPTETKISVQDTAGVNVADIDIFAGLMILEAFNPANDRATIQLDAGDILMSSQDGASGNNKQFNLQVISGNGIQIVDAIDNIGLQGDTLFPVNGNPNQYVQAGNVGVTGAVTDSTAETTSLPANVSFVMPSDGIVRVNGYSFFRSGLGSVAITVDYIDVIGNPQLDTLSLVACSAANVATSYPPIVIKAGNGTTVNVNWVLTGAMTYDGGGTIELLARV